MFILDVGRSWGPRMKIMGWGVIIYIRCFKPLWEKNAVFRRLHARMDFVEQFYTGLESIVSVVGERTQ